MPVHVETPTIEISAPPERVRAIVLDFPKLSEWSTAQFTSIVSLSGKSGPDLVEGDKLEVVLAKFGITFSPVVIENSPSKFRWRGSVPGIFTGDHVYEFLPSEEIVGGTKFVHYEDFSGVLSFTMKPEKKSGQQNMDGFKTFNADLKKRAEGEK